MASVEFIAGTSVDTTLTSERTIKIWTSPATMDSGDTVTLPTIADRAITIISAFDAADGNSIVATVSGQVVTLDAGGSATDSLYTIQYMYL